MGVADCDAKLHVQQEDCGCITMRCDDGCKPRDILKALHLDWHDVTCKQHGGFGGGQYGLGLAMKEIGYRHP